MLGLGSVAADISIGVRFGLGARKRKRAQAPLDLNGEPDTMDTHTVVFGANAEGDVRAGWVPSS